MHPLIRFLLDDLHFFWLIIKQKFRGIDFNSDLTVDSGIDFKSVRTVDIRSFEEWEQITSHLDTKSPEKDLLDISEDDIERVKMLGSKSNSWRGLLLTPKIIYRILIEDWRADLEERLHRLKKAKKTKWFIRFKIIQYLLELLWGFTRIQWENIWLRGNNKIEK